MYDLTSWCADRAAQTLGSFVAADIDGDGNIEFVSGGDGALIWLRPSTGEQGVIDTGDFHCGLAVEDIEGDGKPEIVAGKLIRRVDGREEWSIVRYTPTGGMRDPWTLRVIDPLTTGGPHDLVFADIDHDGRRELVANSCYTKVWGVFILRPDNDPEQPWRRHTVYEGISGEGLVIADIDNDGMAEVFNGPVYYRQPAGGPYAGPWTPVHYAPSMREMCRVAILDIRGNGGLDAVVVESEFPDGRLSWFENLGGDRWSEHSLEGRWTFAHSLQAWRAGPSTTFFIAEMAQGGWNAARNLDARVCLFHTADNGASWSEETVGKNFGTHQALAADIDGDREIEIAGKSWQYPAFQIWKKASGDRPRVRFDHRFIDRDKPCTGTDILAVDIDNDGCKDIVCARWWYRYPSWERYEIPGIYQVHTAYDIDGDGGEELIATKTNAAPSGGGWYGKLSSVICWLKPIDPRAGLWEEFPVGIGSGDWPHGMLVAPVLPDRGLALLCGYHNAEQGHWPELFEIPADPRRGPWKRRVVAEVPFGEEVVAGDLFATGLQDLIIGPFVLCNRGDASFDPFRYADNFDPARCRICDINGDGLPDIVAGEERLDYPNRKVPLGTLCWFENPGKPGAPWRRHDIDRALRCPHSLDMADLDGDGRPEIICGEHDPFAPYRSRCRLMMYTMGDRKGLSWKPTVIDGRFEHHDGAKIVRLTENEIAIAGHGWAESRYVHLWSVAAR